MSIQITKSKDAKVQNNIAPKCKMESVGAVLIEGPKWSGKTWTAAKKSKSILYMQDPDTRESNILAASVKPSLILKGETPRLIDEWQVAPVLWDSVRHEVDMRGEEGMFILTGSATPIIDEQISHTGTGMVSRMKMRPMSLFESNESTGEVSLKELFEQDNDIGSISNLEIEGTAKAIVRGGWPASVTSKPESASKRAQDYVDSIVQFDVSRIDGIEKNPNKVFALLRSLSRNISTEANHSVLLNTLTT